MGSYKIKRLELSKNVIATLEKQNLYTCKDTLTLTMVELQYLLGIRYEEAKNIFSIISRKCVSEPQTVYDLLVDQRKRKIDSFFPTSLCDLDILLQGGLLKGSVTEIVGPPGVGKTQFCLMISLLATLPNSMGGLDGQVIYIDTESAFSASRLKRMAQSKYPKYFQSEKDIQNLLQKIFVHKAASVYALKEILPNIEQDVIRKRVKLVIIDSIASLFRKEYGASVLQSIVERNNILLKQASVLKDLAHTYDIVVLLTNQITSHSVEYDPVLSEYFIRGEEDENEYNQSEINTGLESNPLKKSKFGTGVNIKQIIPALGTTWSHCVNTRLMAQFLDSEVRQLIIAKSPVAPNAAVLYTLNEAGFAVTGDVENIESFNTENQNIRTKYNFLLKKVTEPFQK